MTDTSIPQKSGQIAARLAVAAPIGFVLLLMLLHLIRPDVSPSWQPISDYALGSNGWIMTLAFLCWGIGPLTLALTLWPRLRGIGTRIGLSLLLLGTLGPFLAAIFPTDPTGTLPDQMTTGGMIHASAAALADLIVLGGLILSIIHCREGQIWQAWRRAVLGTAILAMLLLIGSGVALGMLMPESGVMGPEVTVGWIMRAYAVVSNLWVMVAAWATYQAGR